MRKLLIAVTLAILTIGASQVSAQLEPVLEEVCDALGCEKFCPVCPVFPASGQTNSYAADKNDGIAGPVAVPDDGAVEAGGTLAYSENGDGTITDLNTGLMWEKKGDSGGLHDKDNLYVWSGNGLEETIWDWLDDVNSEGGTGFAGHNDWRIPNVREFQSIVNYGAASPAVSPAFNTGCTGGCSNTTCSCTVSSGYWSGTTQRDNPNAAWHPSFGFGSLGASGKGISFYVRAVRGGSL
jgi:hypothetical protein